MAPKVGAAVVLAAGVDEKLKEKDGLTPVAAAAGAAVVVAAEAPNNGLAFGSLVD